MSDLRQASNRTRLLAGAALLGFAALALAFVPSPLRLLDYFESVPLPQIRAPQRLKLAPMLPDSAFAEITARPIFNQGRLPDPPTAVRPADEAGSADLSQFHLVGIVTNAATQLALVRRGEGPTTVLRKGDSLEGWRVEKIDVLGVTASDGIRSARLVIPRAQNNAPSP